MRYRLPFITLRSVSGAASTTPLLVNIGVMLGASMLTGCFTGLPKEPAPFAAVSPPAFYDTRPVVQHDLFAAPFRLGTDRAAR
jgi:hypothetical protein